MVNLLHTKYNNADIHQTHLMLNAIKWWYVYINMSFRACNGLFAVFPIFYVVCIIVIYYFSTLSEHYWQCYVAITNHSVNVNVITFCLKCNFFPVTVTCNEIDTIWD